MGTLINGCHVFTRICVCMCVYKFMFKYACMCVYTCICIFMFACTMYVCMFICVNVCMHACMHYAHTHTHTHTHNSHTRTHSLTHPQVDARADTYGRGSPRSPCRFRALGVSSHALQARPTCRICTLGTLSVSLQARLFAANFQKIGPHRQWKPGSQSLFVCSNERTNAFENRRRISCMRMHTCRAGVTNGHGRLVSFLSIFAQSRPKTEGFLRRKGAG